MTSIADDILIGELEDFLHKELDKVVQFYLKKEEEATHLFDDIEEFSSPERSARKKKPRIEPLTQDTIEDFSVDHFIDWGGGMPPEDPLPLTQEEEENAVNLSHLTPPEGQSQVASYLCRHCSC